MRIRSYGERDLAGLIELTTDTFGPFYERHFRPLVGERVFAHQHGSWREDYRAQVPTLHDPPAHEYVALAEKDDALLGYVAWHIDPAHRHGEIEILAIAHEQRRCGVGRALCQHAFADMRDHGAEVVEIGTGGDAFHTPARALYSSLGCTELPTTVFFKQL